MIWIIPTLLGVSSLVVMFAPLAVLGWGIFKFGLEDAMNKREALSLWLIRYPFWDLGWYLIFMFFASFTIAILSEVHK